METFSKGHQWEIIKSFKGKSHEEGGIDITIDDNGISMTNTQGMVKAKGGLVIPSLDLQENNPIVQDNTNIQRKPINTQIQEKTRKQVTQSPDANIYETPTTRDKISRGLTDTGARLLHGVETFGGSLIGDALGGIDPKIADNVAKFTFGMIAPTPQSKLDAAASDNPNRWSNRIEQANEAATMYAAGELGGAALAKGLPYLGKALQGLGKGTQKAIKVDDVGKGFKSEIDWTKWNKEIPKNTQLMKEYNTIEYASKANGTWMKNPDGSAFKGTPEQFVQQQSSNFKKAFGKDNEILYHATSKEFNTFDLSHFNKNSASTSKKVPATYLTNNKLTASDFLFDEPGKIMELYSSGNTKTIEGVTNFTKSKINLQAIKNEGFDKFVVKNTSDLYMPKALRRVLDGIGNAAYKSDIHGIFDPTKIKSAVGNNGMFDMTNPNIYKGLVPAAIGTGAALTSEQKLINHLKQQ